MGGLRGGVVRLGLALGLGTVLGLGGAWVAAQADGPAGRGRICLVAQKTKKKSTKAKKGMAGKADAAAKEKAEDDAPDDGTLRFSRDIAPIFVGNCIGCHNPNGNNAKAAALNLTTFQGIMTGTTKRKVIAPGDPDGSPLVQRLRGEETPKMPQGNNAKLADETIEKVAAWVKQGARLDAGKDPSAAIKSYARTPEEIMRAELAKLTPEQRDKRVEDAGLERWKKVNPNTAPETTRGTHFLLFSALPKERATALLKVMDAQQAAVRKFLTPPGVPVLDGPLKVAIYVFNDANGFVELARSLENRDLEPNTTAVANFGNEYPYLAAVDPLGGREDAPEPAAAKKGAAVSKMRGFGGPERSLAGLLTEQLAAAAVSRAKGSDAPRWLSLGVGAYFGARVEPRSPYYNHLRSEAFQQYQLGWGEKSKEVIGDATDADKLRAVGFSLVEWLAKEQGQDLQAFVNGMLEGSEKLDAGLETLWQMKRDNFLAAWGEWISAHYSRAR